MTWEIVLGLIALVGVTVTLGGVLVKLTATLTRLDTTLSELRETVKALRESNNESHRRIWIKLDNHEGRIHELESRGRDKNAAI